MRQSWETMTSVSAGHIKLTLTQPVGSGPPQRELNLGTPDQESCPLLTELSRLPIRSQLESNTNTAELVVCLVDTEFDLKYCFGMAVNM